MARDDGVLSISIPAIGPRPLVAFLYYFLGPLLGVLLAVVGRRPAVVVCRSPFEAFGAIVFSRFLPKSLRPPIQIELHGEWTSATRLYGSRARRLLSPGADRIARWSLKRADRVRAVSSVLAERARKVGCVCPIDVHITHSDFGTFLDRPVTPPSASKQVLFAGVLERYKGVDVLIEAWPRVLQRVPDASLLIVGSGHQEESLRKQVRDCRLDGKVDFHPSVSRERLQTMIDDAACVVLPSRSEGLPRLVLEVMARGRPIVATKVGATADLVLDGETGWLVHPDDPVTLADRIVTVLTDRAAAYRMGEAARARAEDRNPAEEYEAGIARLARWAASA